MRSPGAAVLRRMARPSGTVPMTVMSARTPVGDCGDIAAGEGDAGGFGGFQQAVEELVGPALRQVGGQGEREKRGKGLAAHGRDVGESAGEAAVADRVGGMPLAAEVHAFEGEVGGDQGLRAGEGGEQGAVVSDGLEDAGRGGAALGWERRLAGLRDAFDETVFRDRHDADRVLRKQGGGKAGQSGFQGFKVLKVSRLKAEAGATANSTHSLLDNCAFPTFGKG